MREILFKARTLSDGRWITGQYMKWYESGKVRHFITWVDEVNWNWREEIDRETLSEFTGHITEDNQKVFENDIILYYATGGSGVHYVPGGFITTSPKYTDSLTQLGGAIVRVLGNIHDDRKE